MKAPDLPLNDQLRYLNLPRIKEIYQQAAQEASRKNLSHLQFFEHLISEESSARFSRRVASYLKMAQIPRLKTIDAFDWAFPRKIPKQRILGLLDLKFVSEKTNVIFLGPAGTGKSHFAQAIAYLSCLGGTSTRFATAIEIINQLNAALCDKSFLQVLSRFTKPELLIIDELGFLPVDKQGADLLFQVISARYERGSVIVTSNRDFKEWGKIFNNDNTIAAALIDRLAHHSDVIIIDGDSYRMKDKEKD